MDRYKSTLLTLARGNAIANDRDYLDEEDIRLISHVVISTCSDERSKIMRKLLSNAESVKVDEFEEILEITTHTTKNKCNELVTLGAIESMGSPMQYILPEKLDWLKKYF